MNNADDNPLLESCRSLIGSSLSLGEGSLITWLDGVLLDIQDGSAAVVYTVRPQMTNPSGVLHGGIAATMMDEVAGMMTLVSHGGRYFASVNMAIDFLSPAQIGEQVTARARIVRRGRRLVNVECTLARANGELVARASTNLLAVGSGNG